MSKYTQIPNASWFGFVSKEDITIFDSYFVMKIIFFNFWEVCYQSETIRLGLFS